MAPLPLHGQTASISLKQHIYHPKQYHGRNNHPTISHTNTFDCATVKRHIRRFQFCRIGLCRPCHERFCRERNIRLCRLRYVNILDLCHVVNCSVNDVHEDLRCLTTIFGKRGKSSNTVSGLICNPIVREIRQCRRWVVSHCPSTFRSSW